MFLHLFAMIANLKKDKTVNQWLQNLILWQFFENYGGKISNYQVLRMKPFVFMEWIGGGEKVVMKGYDWKMRCK